MIKKVGVITYHNVTNYGAVMQAYCLQKALREVSSEIGVQVEAEVIDYRPWRSIFYYYLRHFVKKREISYYKKIFAFSNFRKKYLALSSERRYKNDRLSVFNDKYDLVITGSDEVWKIGEIRGWDSNYFLSFVSKKSNTKKASYAVSANAAKGLDERKNEIKGYLQDYIGVSVRDSKTKDVVKELFEVNAEEVLDPTLITDTNVELEPIANDIGKYILLYTTLKKIPNNVHEYAKRNELKLVCVGSEIKGADFCYPNASPEEWLSLINQSSLVITNFFHGVLLSIKMGKNFLPMYSGNKKFKIFDVSEKLEFKDRLIEQKELKNIEADRIQDLLVSGVRDQKKFKEMSKSSREYLSRVLMELK